MSDSLSVLNTANISQLLSNSGFGIVGQVSITSNVTGISTTTTIMTTPTILWRSNRAYQVNVWGLALNTSAATSYVVFQLHRGTGTGGTTWKDQIRFNLLPLATSTVNTAISFSTILVNTSGADFSTTMTLTMSVNTGTANFSASAGNVAYMTVCDVGSAVNVPGQPIS